MRETLRQRLAKAEPLFFGWTSLPGVHHAIAMAGLPFEAVLLDQQHGLIGHSDSAAMVPAINGAGKHSIVRALWNDAGLIGQALDVGASAVIVPMVNSVADAQRIVQAAKYPPRGGRSWGSYAVSQYEGLSKEQYLAQANDLTMIVAMIETQEALDCVDAICAVEGLDGIFVGPNDMSISISKGARLDAMHEVNQKAYAKIAKSAKAAGIPAGIFGGAPAFVKNALAMGYDFISSGADVGMMDAGARAFLAAVKP
jgi:4-hydroxy-2-oxoheptanedioate aldolase